MGGEEIEAQYKGILHAQLFGQLDRRLLNPFFQEQGYEKYLESDTFCILGGSRLQLWLEPQPTSQLI